MTHSGVNGAVILSCLMDTSEPSLDLASLAKFLGARDSISGPGQQTSQNSNLHHGSDAQSVESTRKVRIFLHIVFEHSLNLVNDGTGSMIELRL